MTDSKSNQFIERVMSDRMRWMAKWLRLRDYALSENTLKEYLFITYNAARSVWPFRYAARKVYCLNQKANIPLGNDALHNLIQKAEQREQPMAYRNDTIITILGITPEEVTALEIGHNMKQEAERRQRAISKAAARNQVKSLFLQGLTTAEIAAVVPGMHHSTINRILQPLREQQQADFTARIKQLKDSGASVTEIARLCSVSRTTVYKALSVHENALLDETVEEVDYQIQMMQPTPERKHPDLGSPQDSDSEGVSLRHLDGRCETELFTTTIEKTVIKPTEQALAYSLLVNTKQNICLLGFAGTGKSTLLESYLSSLPKPKRQRVLVTAPTNLAALRINGQTIHRAFGLKPELQPTNRITKIPKHLLKYDTLIIDEIGVVSIDVFSRVMQILNYIKRKYKKAIRIIVCGDFSQIEPVGTKDKDTLYKYYPAAKNGIFAFNAPAWEKCHFKKIVLSTVHRQKDYNFVSHLEQIRQGNRAAVTWFNENADIFPPEDAITICPTNKLVEEYNHYGIIGFPNPVTIEANVTGNISTKDLPCPMRLTIAVGARVMTVVNEKGYKNGSMGTVTEISSKYIKVRFDESGKEVSIRKKSFTVDGGSIKNYPIQLAYAITAHKAQGMQFRTVEIVPGFWAVGQLYVALSRVSELKNLYITGTLKPSECVVNKSALTMMNCVNE